jgi:5'-3' exonuclease
MIVTLLVDGEYLLKRSFLVKSNHYTTEGGNINGLFNFMVTLRSLVNNLGINKIVVCWDGQNGGKMRYNIYRGYKANREHKEWYNKIELSDAQIEFEKNKKESLLKQKVRIQNYLEELFVRQIYDLDIIEADDMIAYYVQNFNLLDNKTLQLGNYTEQEKNNHKEKIYIFTNDRDLCQLVEYDNVSIYLANLKKVINKLNYFTEFQHDYRNLRIIKTFCGDQSDNIQGIKGLKETTLLNNFPHIKNTPVTVDQIITEAKNLSLQRTKEKKKPLLVLENIINGITNEKDFKGDEVFDINYRLVNLKEPMLTREAKHSIMEIATTPLSSDDRGSKNLIKLMNEDGFLKLWSGNINTYCKPFYPLLIREKKYFEDNL